MRPEDWRAAQVKIKTFELPPTNNIGMAKSSNNVTYDGHIKAAFENEKFMRKSRSIISKNRYLTLKVKALEAEKGVLEEKLVSLGKDPQTSAEVVHILKEKQEQIKALGGTKPTIALLLMQKLSL